MEDEFKYYDKKIEELTQLLSHTQSITLKELISKSINLTLLSLETLLLTQATTVEFLRDHNISTSQKLLNYNKQYELLSTRCNQINTLTNVVANEKILINQLLSDSDEFQKNINFEAELNDLVLETFSDCQSKIEKTLLEFIVKPNNKEFQYKQVMDILNFILSKLQIPGLDEINILSNLSIMSKKKEYVKTGDKIILYIEQYIEVLEKWNFICKNYVKIMKS